MFVCFMRVMVLILLNIMPSTACASGDTPIGNSRSDRRQSGGGGDNFKSVSDDQLSMLVHTIDLIVYV